jgi:hypothetical protein
MLLINNNNTYIHTYKHTCTHYPRRQKRFLAFVCKLHEHYVKNFKKMCEVWKVEFLCVLCTKVRLCHILNRLVDFEEIWQKSCQECSVKFSILLCLWGLLIPLTNLLLIPESSRTIILQNRNHFSRYLNSRCAKSRFKAWYGIRHPHRYCLKRAELRTSKIILSVVRPPGCCHLVCFP